MKNTIIHRAELEDWPYIKEKLHNYILDKNEADWQKFFVAKNGSKVVAFGRIINHGDYFEIGSLGVDYYHRGKGIGIQLLSFLVKEARKLDPQKAIYGVTHRPGFVEKAGFVEISNAPEALELKKSNCIDPSKVKIMRSTR
ncbi:GNAT family N-acetyltransferase [Candidatus Omnitrophota bacterium]